MREEQHEMIHSHASERPALAIRTARNDQQWWARRRSGRPRKPLMQCNTLSSFLRMGHVSSAADARESLRGLIRASGRLWTAECVEVCEDQNLRQVERSRFCWSGAGAEVMRDLVKLLAGEHGVAVEVFFSVEMSKRPSTVESVERPGLSCLLAATITRKSYVLSHVLAHSWQPIRCGNVFSILLFSRRRILGKFHRLKIF